MRQVAGGDDHGPAAAARRAQGVDGGADGRVPLRLVGVVLEVAEAADEHRDDLDRPPAAHVVQPDRHELERVLLAVPQFARERRLLADRPGQRVDGVGGGGQNAMRARRSAGGRVHVRAAPGGQPLPMEIARSSARSTAARARSQTDAHRSFRW
ncbi:MAG: hypothetical protein U0470_09475 [Anaerolineae bacterium]